MDGARQATDSTVLAHIQQLVDEEHRLFEKGTHGTAENVDVQRLSKVQVELDQCWDLLRQRRALRNSHVDPNMAQVRPAQIVENYEQ